MALPELSLLGIFLTGLLGGVHCAGMCGGIVSALGMVNRQPVARQINIPVMVVGVATAPNSSVVRHALSASATVAYYNLGRVSTYTVLGALAGGVGSTAWLIESVLPVQQGAYFISNLLLILMGLYVIGFKRIGVMVESLGAHLWKLIRPAATARLAGTGTLNAILAGSLWGLVPCGMVYAVLAAALVSGSWHQGALLMLVFGLGTLPNLVVLGLSGEWLARASRKLWVRRIAGGLIMVFGMMGFMHLSMS